MPIEKNPIDLSGQEKELRALLGRNIKQCRFRLGISQLDLALTLNISPTFLSDVENGKKWPSPHTLVRIAEALHVAAHDFFTPEEEVIPEIAKALDACFVDIRLALKQSVEKSIEESIKKVMEYYLKPLETASHCFKMQP
ncbi:MAG: hypothetical protein Pg6A_05730 [Termitinemataceae bacterium]|nr:MAG: hypothetical protein Pg6A_05730 [Termitinemataceae bacterium]